MTVTRLPPLEVSSRKMLTILLHTEGTATRVHLQIPVLRAFTNQDWLQQHHGDTLVVDYEVGIDLAVTRDKLRESLKEKYRNRDLGPAIMAASGCPPEALRGAFGPLAVLGRYTFNQMFRNIEPECAPAHADVVRATVLEALRTPQAIAIQSETPLFPWALLYDDDDFHGRDYSTLRPTSFWGFRHELQHQVKPAATTLQLPARPKQVAAICPALEQAFPGSMGCGTAVQISTTADLATALSRFDADILYFFGHAGHESPPHATTSWLAMNHGKITVSELQDDYRAPVFDKTPVLVFLNGCNMSPLETWNEATVAGFLAHKAKYQVCCIAPIAEVPDWLAATFARRFWTKFLGGTPVGTAIRESRCEVMDENQNPLALLYELFGRAGTHIPVRT